MTLEETEKAMWAAFLRGDAPKADSLARQVLRCRPHHCRAKTLQAVFAWRNGATDLGVKLALEACSYNPQDLEAARVAARQLMEAGHRDQALTYYERARALASDLASEIDHALALLAAEHWAEGWELYECRVPRELGVAKFSPAKPQWNGKVTDRLLVLPEAGFGDAIQFYRYAKAYQGNLVLWTRKALGRLFESQGTETCTLAQGATLPAHTSWAFSMSLPHLGANPLPKGQSYLEIPSGVSGVQRRRGLPAVGLVWGGSPMAPRDRLRSLPVEYLEKILSHDFVDWHILQQGPYLNLLRPHAHLSQVHTHPIKDFLDTAQVIADLDLVLTIDTSVAHLAGAMGKPCWVLLSTTPDFRYPGVSTTTPWYESLRLFRQPSPGAWNHVVEEALSALRDFHP